MHLVTPSDVFFFFMLRIYSFLSVDLTSAHGCRALFSTTTSKDAVACENVCSSLAVFRLTTNSLTVRFVSVQKTFAVATVGIV